MQPLEFRNGWVISSHSYWACDYLFMLGLKLIHASKRGYWQSEFFSTLHPVDTESLASTISIFILVGVHWPCTFNSQWSVKCNGWTLCAWKHILQAISLSQSLALQAMFTWPYFKQLRGKVYDITMHWLLQPLPCFSISIGNFYFSVYYKIIISICYSGYCRWLQIAKCNIWIINLKHK